MSRLSTDEKATVTAVLRHVAERDGPGSPAHDQFEFGNGVELEADGNAEASA